LNYLLVGALNPPAPWTRHSTLPEATHLPTLHDILTPLGIAWFKIPTRQRQLRHRASGLPGVFGS
jgi:hypothetical protein